MNIFKTQVSLEAPTALGPYKLHLHMESTDIDTEAG